MSLENLSVRDLIELVSVLKKDTKESNFKKEDMRYVIIRTYSAGVFAGNIESRNGREVVLRNARRLWKWSGAKCLSDLSVYGVKNPEDCRFPCEVDRIELLEAIEVIDCTKEAEKSIKEVFEWKE